MFEAVCVVVGVVIVGGGGMLYMSHRIRVADERRRVLDAIEKAESARPGGLKRGGQVRERRVARASTSRPSGHGDGGMMSTIFGASMFSGGSDCGGGGGGGFDGGSC